MKLASEVILCYTAFMLFALAFYTYLQGGKKQVMRTEIREDSLVQSLESILNMTECEA